MCIHLCSTLHVPKDDPTYDSSAIAHFYDKMLHIREHLKTEPGKRLAEKRHQLVGTHYCYIGALLITFRKMVVFLSAVDEEYDVRL